MKKISATILFFGSGPVAAKSLAKLAEDFVIEAVVTKPSPAHHKGDFPVVKLANQLGLKVLNTSNKLELSQLFAGQPVTSRLGLVIDYGIIIPKAVIDYFPLGIVNSHFSLLPEWRGADPITFSILSGQSLTGISLMLLVEKLDEGPLLGQATWEIKPYITTPSLTEELIDLSHQALVEVLPLYVNDKIQPTDQLKATLAASKTPSYSRKLTKADGVIDWTKPAERLEREVRAYAGWPRSRTRLGSIDVIVTQTRVIPSKGQPGSLNTDSRQLVVYCGQDALAIEKLIPAGKKEMPAKAFLAGYRTSLDF